MYDSFDSMHKYHGQLDGATENAGVENAAHCRGGKRGSNEYGKPKFPLFNIVTSALQQPIELMWIRTTLRICIFFIV